MRVLYVVDFWEAVGGIETVSGHVVESLVRLGAEVRIWSVRESGEPVRDGFVARGLAPRNRLARSVHARGLWRRQIAAAVRREAKHADLCIVGHAGLLAPVLDGLNDRIPCWVWAYGLEVWGVLGASHAAALGRAERIIAISDFTARQLARWVDRSRVRVIPCAVDTQTFTPAADQDATGGGAGEILVVGRLAAAERYKGHDVLLDALPEIRTEDGPARLSIIGDGDDRARLEARCRELGLTERVRFRGRVTAAELIDAYRRCAVFAMPSRVEEHADRPWTGEGFGIVYLEAAACGRPVVASTDGGAPETVDPGTTGLLADPRDPSAVAEAISSILTDSQRAGEMGRRGREWVENHFSVQRLQERIREMVS